MTRRNRVDPWGDLHATSERGMLTGNRGCLVDESRRLTRHHAGNLWITCVTEFRDWRHPLDAPHRWTPLFFLDDAVALAAGHRPCGFCRRDDYLAYRDAVRAATPDGLPLKATTINELLATQRLRPGSGLNRRADRRTWRCSIDELPDGAVIVDPGRNVRVVIGSSTLRFSFGGWDSPIDRPASGVVDVLTPPLSVDALRGGFRPTLHRSIAAAPHVARR